MHAGNYLNPTVLSFSKALHEYNYDSEETTLTGRNLQTHEEAFRVVAHTEDAGDDRQIPVRNDGNAARYRWAVADCAGAGTLEVVLAALQLVAGLRACQPTDKHDRRTDRQTDGQR